MRLASASPLEPGWLRIPTDFSPSDSHNCHGIQFLDGIFVASLHVSLIPVSVNCVKVSAMSSARVRILSPAA